MRALASFAAVLGLAQCSKAPPRGAATGEVPPASTDGGGAVPGPAVPLATVTLATASGPRPVRVEVVKSAGRVQRGLMYRKFLGADDGMLFLMGDLDDHHFWMQNTLIPLDIMFIGDDLRVVGILENMQPLDTTSRGVGKPSRYVLEVNGGYAKQHDIGPGTAVTFAGVEAAAQ
jgi:uncharacterized membrane protein (UPF0127 family)